MEDVFVLGDMIRTMRHGVLALALASVLASGCGPVAYINQVPRDAAGKVDQARALNAAKFSPYWWTRANEYLRMSRDVAGHADFQGADRFGRLATEAANQAAVDARIAAKDPSKRPRDVPPDAAPARTTEAPIAPARDLPPAPGKSPPAPARGGRPARVAPAKDPP